MKKKTTCFSSKYRKPIKTAKLTFNTEALVLGLSHYILIDWQHFQGQTSFKNKTNRWQILQSAEVMEVLKCYLQAPQWLLFDRGLLRYLCFLSNVSLFRCISSPYLFMSINAITVFTTHKTITATKLPLILSSCGYINYLFTLRVHEIFIGTI